MTVKELKELLSEYDEDMEVAIQIDFDKWRDIRKVGYAERYKKIHYDKDTITLGIQGIIAIE